MAVAIEKLAETRLFECYSSSEWIGFKLSHYPTVKPEIHGALTSTGFLSECLISFVLSPFVTISITIQRNDFRKVKEGLLGRGGALLEVFQRIAVLVFPVDAAVGGAALDDLGCAGGGIEGVVLGEDVVIAVGGEDASLEE